MIDFEWDENKAIINLAKHGISFEEAKSAFYDDKGLFYFDEKHSKVEHRYILIGCTNIGNLVVISYTIRDYKFRIISCRKVNKIERGKYEGKNAIH